MVRAVLRNVPFGGAIYYRFFNSSFNRELNAVFKGQEFYQLSVNSPEVGNNLLRRNIHRIEKGLAMKDRRDLFGLAYLAETLDAFISYRENNREGSEYRWFRDVFTQYFKAVRGDKFLDAHRMRFFKAIEGEKCGDRHPYHRDLKHPLDCSYEDLLQVAIRRRSVRFFKDEKVKREDVERAVKIAAYSATACNRQPYSFKFFDDPHKISILAKLPMGTTGYDHQIPCLGVVIGHLDSYFSERDRHLIYIDASLAVTPFMFACETLGLSTCAINWPDIEVREQKMAKELELKPWQRPIMLIAIGYPDTDVVVPRSEKKSISELVEWNLIR